MAIFDQTGRKWTNPPQSWQQGEQVMTDRNFFALTIAFTLLLIGGPAFGADDAAAEWSVSDTDQTAAIEPAAFGSVKDGPAKGDGPCGKGCCCDGLSKAIAGSHKPLFYDNNFDYLCDPCYDDWHLGDNLKRMCIGDSIVLDIGGQYRVRQHNEWNMRNTGTVPNALGLTGADDNFVLHRTRLYANAEVGSRLRFFIEGLDAVSNYENLNPRPIEENRFDLQNLFVDYLAFDGACGTLTTRFGRQELLYGAQRMASPLDWANTRRTFEGAKLMWRGENWDIDSFWVRPMRRVTDQLDPPNLDQEWYGIYSTYKGLCQDKLDLYWLAMDLHDIDVLYDTVGARYHGSRDVWLFDMEGGMQFGRNGNGTDHSAGFYSGGLGRKFDCALWSPTVWMYYDWASGGDLGNGFHHNYPLSHKYLGFMDLFGRRNIEDLNLQVAMTPHERVKLLLWFHHFRLANANDVPYNVNMSAFNGLAPGVARDRDLGQELDIVLNYTVGPRTNLLFGYSHFYAGSFYRNTAGLPHTGDADFYYTQLQVNF